jgi:hypothetical protein
VDTIGSYAFYQTSLLTDLYINAIVPPRLDSLAFYATRLDLPIHVPCGKIEIYKAAVLWDRFTNITDDFPQLAVRVNDATMGSVAVTDAATCENDSTAIITATTAADCFFAGWSDGGGTDNPRTIKLTQDTSLVAVFGELT